MVIQQKADDDYIILKYNSGGVKQWSKQDGTSAHDSYDLMEKYCC